MDFVPFIRFQQKTILILAIEKEANKQTDKSERE